MRDVVKNSHNTQERCMINISEEEITESDNGTQETRNSVKYPPVEIWN
jgi:hypothetical protein